MSSNKQEESKRTLFLRLVQVLAEVLLLFSSRIRAVVLRTNAQSVRKLEEYKLTVRIQSSR